MTEGDDASHRFLSRIRQELDKLPLTKAHRDDLAPKLLQQARFLDTTSRRNNFENLRIDSALFDFARKISDVEQRFEADGLTLTDYLCAAVKQPPLFCQSPAAIIANIEGVAGHFCNHGLTLTGYLRAALKQPSLFYQSPATIIANIQSVAGHFRDQGLTLKDYLRAAGMQPQLFYQSPETIIRHVRLIINLHHQGWLTFPGEPIVSQPLKPMFAYLVKNPLLLCLSDDNYALREAYARLTGKRFRGTSLLTRHRHQLEKEFAAASGLADIPDAAQPRNPDHAVPSSI
jgi:hypothetical protein